MKSEKSTNRAKLQPKENVKLKWNAPKIVNLSSEETEGAKSPRASERSMSNTIGFS